MGSCIWERQQWVAIVVVVKNIIAEIEACKILKKR